MSEIQSVRIPLGRQLCQWAETELRFLTCFLILLFGSPAFGALKVGDKFPPIELNYLNTEKKFDKKTMVGKVVLIDVWGSDCPPCRLAMPKMNSIYLNLRNKNFLILGINVDESDDDLNFFLTEYKVDYPLLDDRKHRFVKLLGLEVMPTSFLVDQSGRVRYIHRGFRSGDGPILEKRIQSLLK